MKCKHTNAIHVGFETQTPQSRPTNIQWCRCCGAVKRQWTRGQRATWRKARHGG